MKNKSGVFWLSKGRVVNEPDLNATAMLLDLGALDSVDYFADGEIRCVVATEDTDKENRALLSNGFVDDDTEIASYTGCTKVEAALVLGGFLREKAPHVRLVIHRDRDYLSLLAADILWGGWRRWELARSLPNQATLKDIFLTQSTQTRWNWA